jgi:hypothetical protein
MLFYKVAIPKQTPAVDWHFNAGLWKFDGFSVISFGILGFPVSIEMTRQCKGLSGLNRWNGPKWQGRSVSVLAPKMLAEVPIEMPKVSLRSQPSH